MRSPRGFSSIGKVFPSNQTTEKVSFCECHINQLMPCKFDTIALGWMIIRVQQSVSQWLYSVYSQNVLLMCYSTLYLLFRGNDADSESMRIREYQNMIV